MEKDIYFRDITIFINRVKNIIKVKEINLL